MDEARIKSTGEPVAGEDLWYSSPIEKDDFKCFHCTVSVTPCSYKKDINKKRPYFKLSKVGTEHDEGCPFHPQSTILKKAKETRVSTEEGFPLPYPCKLSFPDPIKVKPNGKTVGIDSTKSIEAPPFYVAKGAARHRYTTNSFRSVVNHYLAFPYDRDADLEIEGIDCTSYYNAFIVLQQPNAEDSIVPIQKGNKIYFSPMGWKNVVMSPGQMTITLSRGLWIEQAGKQHLQQSYYINIDITTWPSKSIESLKFEVRKGLDDVKENKNKKLEVFFIGVQDTQGDPYCMKVSSHRKICIKVVDKLKKKKRTI